MPVLLTTPITPELIKQKLEAFDRLQAEFEESFRFVQNVHGQQRFLSFPVADSVRYLHALWVCECKDRLLSIYKNIERYEGRYSLKLLRRWQEGDTADVVDFLNRKLDMLPFAEITRQVHEARHQLKNEGLARRLEHGRTVLLNRSMNLMQALNAIFVMPEDELVREVQVACAQYGHHPSQLEKQLAEMETPLYAYVPHQALAQRNMAVMNKMGMKVMNLPTDQPGERSWRVLEPTEPPGPFAEHVLEGYVALTLPDHNNLRRLRFVDLPERSISSAM
jgi:hypothetical protein